MDFLIEDTFLPKAVSWASCQCCYCSSSARENQPTWICRAFNQYFPDASREESLRKFFRNFIVFDWNTSTMYFTINVKNLGIQQIHNEAEWNALCTSLNLTGPTNDSDNQPERQNSPDPSLAGSMPF